MGRGAYVLQLLSLSLEAILQRWQRAMFSTVAQDYWWSRHQEELGPWQRE